MTLLKKFWLSSLIFMIVLTGCSDTSATNNVHEPVNVYETQIANMYYGVGIIANGDSAYYVGSYEQLDKYAIYKVNINEIGKENGDVIVKDAMEIYWLYDNYIYWSNAADNNYLYRLNLETEENRKIGDFTCSQLIEYDNILLFVKQDEDELYSVKLDGSDQQLICSDCYNNIYPYKDKIYYCSTDNKIKSIDLITKEENEVFNQEISKFFILNDNIYYVVDGNFLMKNLYDDKVEEVEKSSGVVDSSFNICDDLIVYTSLGKIYSYDINTGDKNLVFANGSQFLNVINQKLIIINNSAIKILDPYKYNT